MSLLLLLFFFISQCNSLDVTRRSYPVAVVGELVEFCYHSLSCLLKSPLGWRLAGREVDKCAEEQLE